MTSAEKPCYLIFTGRCSRKNNVKYMIMPWVKMSLGEIAETMGVSRQAVHDMVRRTGKILEEYESKLGLAEKFLDIEAHLEKIRILVSGDAPTEKEQAIVSEIDAIDLIERK